MSRRIDAAEAALPRPRSARGCLRRGRDVADEAQVTAGFDRLVAARGGLDLVVANAATQLIGRNERADRVDVAVWRRTLDVNLTGAFLRGIPGRHFGIAPGLDAYSAAGGGGSGRIAWAHGSLRGSLRDAGRSG